MAGKLQPTTDEVALRIRSLAPEEKKLESWAAELRCTLKEASGYLRGTLRPTWPRMERFVEIYGVSPTWLMLGIGPKSLAELAKAYKLKAPTDEEVLDEIDSTSPTTRGHAKRRKKGHEAAPTGFIQARRVNGHQGTGRAKINRS